ncbi:MAG: iron ABC transporter permease [Deltaproteobacteria bacterium]|nr:iron ABC transporter permease [Deltaproteobacteria bacterium]
MGSYSVRSWSRKTFTSEKLLFVSVTLVIVYLTLPPLAMLFLSSVKSTADKLPIEPAPWTLSNYHQVLADSETYVLLQNSLIYASGVVALSLAIAIVLVWLIERTDLPYRNLVFTLILIPLAIPGLIKAIGWSLLANPRVGVLNVVMRTWLGITADTGPVNIYSLGGIIFVSTLSMVPSVVLMISGCFRNFDPALEEAGETCGVSRLRTQVLVTLPLLRPALLGALIYYFANALDDFQIPAVLGLSAGIRVFSTKIFLATTPTYGLPDYGLASAYAMLLFVLAALLILFYRRTVRKPEQFAVVTGRGYQARPIALGKWKYAALAGIAFYLVLAAVFPLMILLWVSMQPFLSVPSLSALGRSTAAAYVALLEMEKFRAAALNTLIVSVTVATGVMLLSTVSAWISVRSRFWGNWIPDFLTFVNSAVPTVVFGLALMFVYLSFPFLSLYGTIWILVIALLTRYITYTTRLMGGAVTQIHRELEEAALASGASKSSTFLRVTLPLLLPSFVNGWLWVIIHALREATIAILLMTPGNVVLAALIWEKYQEAGDHSLVAAMSLLLTAASLLLTFLGRRALALYGVH